MSPVTIFLTALVLGADLPEPSLPPLGFAGQDETAQCELHVWPAERFNTLAFSMGLIKGSSDEQIEEAMEDLLSPSIQLQALRGIDLTSKLGLPQGTKIVEHNEPLVRKTANKIMSRRAQSLSPCYSELIMMEHKLIEDIVWGDRFQTAFLFRDFADKAEPTRSFRTTAGNKLKVLTQPKDSRPADAQQLVIAAVQANFLEYAKNALPRLAARSKTEN